ncbi:MAG: TetR/AcrR family transcriptional regulator [bacterium]
MMGILERKGREKEHRKAEILQAAHEIFFEKGLQNTTMDEIAEKAELSKGTLYLYYKSKEDLYLAVMMEGLHVLYDLFEQVIDTKESVPVRLKNLGEVYFKYYNEHKNYFRMFYYFQHPHFHKQVSPEMMQSCTIENQRLWKLILDLIDLGIREGDVRPNINSSEVGLILWTTSAALLTKLDMQYEYFKQAMNVDLVHVYQAANALLLDSLLTEQGKQKYEHHGTVS